ncbi:MAG TPA: M15 family metallopeptidase [Oligoflexia bacterium]|nr:M15 family metallopeptidase [Oligoflexia bacterium]
MVNEWNSVPLVMSEKYSTDQLVELDTNTFERFSPHPYLSIESAPYPKGVSPFSLRSTVKENLTKAAKLLNELWPEAKLKIFDCYRPLEVATFLARREARRLMSEDKDQGVFQGDPTNPTEAEYKKYFGDPRQMFAIPSDNPLTPPPHSTGAAVDLTIVSPAGVEIDFGGAVDDPPPTSFPLTYAKDGGSYDQIYDNWRKFLLALMSKFEFARLPREWWHFSFGDQRWAKIQQKITGNSQICAFYPRIG